MQEPTRPNYTHRWRDLDVIQQLFELPDRVLEVLETAGAGAPNPSARAEKTKKPKKPADTLVPVSLDVLDALAPESAGKGVHYEIACAIKAVWEDHPYLALDDEPTLASDCQWLITHASTWQHDVFLCEFVTDAVDHAYRVLTALCRVERAEPPLTCATPGCGSRARIQPGGQWLLCDFGHIKDVEAAKGDWMAMQAWTINETHKALKLYLDIDIPIGTLKGWTDPKRDGLKPVDDGEFPKRYNFAAVIRLISQRRKVA